MHMLWRRYARSGRAPSWFYAILGSGFVSLLILALFEQEWLAAALAFIMAGVTVVAGLLLPRFTAGLDAPAAAGRRRGGANE